MIMKCQVKKYSGVALRKESVDRNRGSTTIITICIVSLSARRAWIEIVSYSLPALKLTSLSARRAWIEIAIANTVIFCFTGSLSARRAWIEIYSHCPGKQRQQVALRKESVDRNDHEMSSQEIFWVALRKESVDRNPWQIRPPPGS